MSEPKRALALHLAGTSEPLMVAIDGSTADDLAAQLAELLRKAEVVTITAANGQQVVVNFANVAAAHVDTVRGLPQILGSPPREN